MKIKPEIFLINKQDSIYNKILITGSDESLISHVTEQVVKQTSESVGKAVSGEIISRLETKLDKILREVATSSEKIDAKHEVELEIAKSQMDDEYDLRKDNLGKIQKDKFDKLEKLIIPLLIKLAKSPEAYIHWPNRAEVIEAQLKKIIAITRN